MSSGSRLRACATSSGFARRVTRPESQVLSARASASPARYQCRLFAFTLPTRTLLRRTISAATSASGRLVTRPPVPRPRGEPTPPAARPDVHVQPALDAEHRGEETDRPRARHEDVLRLPERALADGRDLLPRFRDDRRRLRGHAGEPAGPVHLDPVLGLDPPALRHEAVDLLDAALGVLAVPAHVPLADRAVRTRDGIGASHDADDEIALLQRGGRAGIEDAAERLGPEGET